MQQNDVKGFKCRPHARKRSDWRGPSTFQLMNSFLYDAKEGGGLNHGSWAGDFRNILAFEVLLNS